jgi:hypothetical protein
MACRFPAASEMRLFIKKIILFLAGFLLVSFAGNRIVQWRVDPLACNGMHFMKLAYFAKNAGRYNTVFFGSSLTYRHVNPRIVDERLSRWSVRSFNFGSIATLNPESLYLYEDFLAHGPPRSAVAYAFVELTVFSPIFHHNQYLPRSYYYLNGKYLRLVLHYCASRTDIGWIGKLKMALPFIQGYFLKHFLFKKPEIAKSPGPACLGPGKDGFYAADDELRETRSRAMLRNRREFLRHAAAWRKRRPDPGTRYPPSSFDPAYLEFLEGMIAESRRKGVELFFVIPPRKADNALFYPLKKWRESGRVIDLRDRSEFYSLDMSFDGNHLNRAGADAFSACLADEIRQRLEAVAR